MHLQRAKRLLILVPAVLIGLTILFMTTNQPTQVQAAAPIPNGLPAYVGIGLSGGPNSDGIGSYPGDTSGWIHNSGVPFDYAYQYLAGGVNTNNGWETWGSACSPWSRNFVTCYIQTATADNRMPVFSYYEMLQSNGSCNSCGESQRDLSNLNNSATMAAYYANFTSLMQQIAATGKKVVVHVEPDLSGFVQKASQNPAATPAAVTNTGNADLQNLGLANTYTGYNQALLRLRDKYAPNVLLGFHFSPWAVSSYLGSNTSPNVDVAAASAETANFIKGAGLINNPSGISSWDLLFTDVADRDAAVTGNWWDRNNVTFPNFARWERWVAGIHAATSKWTFVWQVPMGNQYFQTENNTSGHMQDNRAEYFLGHVSELAGSGISAVLFGQGNSGSSNYFDQNRDGLTNPAPITSSNGLNSGTITNNHPAQYSDDDGGYIRIFTKAYYTNGVVSLNGVSQPAPTATPTSAPTVVATSTTAPTATATSTTAPTATATTKPTSAPTATATTKPTNAPTATTKPTSAPTATATTKPTNAPNLLKNGTFEAGNGYDWWIWQAVGVVAGNAHSGNYAMCVAQPPNTVVQTVNGLLPNTTYTFSGWLRSTGNAGDEVRMRVKDYGGAEKVATVTSAAYTRAAVSFTTGTTSTSVNLFFYKQSGSGTACGDDFSLTRG